MKQELNPYKCAVHNMPRTMCSCAAQFEREVDHGIVPQSLKAHVQNGLGVRFGFAQATSMTPSVSYQGQSANMGASMGVSNGASGAGASGPSGGAAGGGPSGPS